MTIDCLGDSVTYGDDGRGGGGPEISWTSHIGALLGAEEVRNYGKNGSRVAICPHHDDSVVERFEAMDFSADAIPVMGGVNDFFQQCRFGAPRRTGSWHVLRCA
jgi:lysophospholipase L1-like esterase